MKLIELTETGKNPGKKAYVNPLSVVLIQEVNPESEYNGTWILFGSGHGIPVSETPDQIAAMINKEIKDVGSEEVA